MAGRVEIKVNMAELDTSVRELSQLAQDLSNRSVQVQFTNAKGDVADKLLAVAEQLNAMGGTLTTLVQNTQAAITNAGTSFAETDQVGAQLWNAGEE